MSQDTQDNVTVITDELAELGVTEEVKEDGQPTETEPQSKTTEEEPTSTEAKDEAEHTEAKESNSRYQKRIDKLVKQREEFAREAETLRKELEAIKSLPKKSEAKELDPLSFDTYEDYIEALNSQQKTEPKKVEKREEPKGDDGYTKEVHRKLDDSFEDAREKYEDFDKVVMDNSLPFTPTMVVAFTEIDNAGEIAYYLAQHKDELKDIASLSNSKQVIALEKIGAKLLNPPKAEKKVTQAPDPINPVKANGDVVEKDPSKMSFSEYEAYMNNKTKKSKGFW